MKVLIELDDDVFNDIRESDFDSARAIVRNFQATITDAIRNGTPIPDNATNGDIIKAMFPDYHVQISTALESVILYYEGIEEYVGSCIRFDLNWWNAPYEKEDL